MYPTKIRESQVCSLAHEASSSEIIRVKHFFSQPYMLFLSIVSMGSRPLPMFLPWIVPECWPGGAKLYKGAYQSVAGPWPCLVSHQSHKPWKCTGVQKQTGEGCLAAEKISSHSLALKMNVKSSRDVSSQCRFSWFPLCLAWMTSAPKTCTRMSIELVSPSFPTQSDDDQLTGVPSHQQSLGMVPALWQFLK